MADDTPVNSQITDSVTQVNTKVVGEAPAMAMGNLYTATGQELSNAAHNATNIDEGIDTAATGKAASRVIAKK